MLLSHHQVHMPNTLVPHGCVLQISIRPKVASLMVQYNTNRLFGLTKQHIKYKSLWILTQGADWDQLASGPTPFFSHSWPDAARIEYIHLYSLVLDIWPDHGGKAGTKGPQVLSWLEAPETGLPRAKRFVQHRLNDSGQRWPSSPALFYHRARPRSNLRCASLSNYRNQMPKRRSCPAISAGSVPSRTLQYPRQCALCSWRTYNLLPFC